MTKTRVCLRTCVAVLLAIGAETWPQVPEVKPKSSIVSPRQHGGGENQKSDGEEAVQSFFFLIFFFFLKSYFANLVGPLEHRDLGYMKPSDG